MWGREGERGEREKGETGDGGQWVVCRQSLCCEPTRLGPGARVQFCKQTMHRLGSEAAGGSVRVSGRERVRGGEWGEGGWDEWGCE